MGNPEGLDEEKEGEKKKKKRSGGWFSFITGKRSKDSKKAEDDFDQQDMAWHMMEAGLKNGFDHPTKKRALQYSALHHPRKPDGKMYSPWSTSTGRHCSYHGCLADGCNFLLEGSASEMARYGPGMSLYFKNLKWMFWVFLLCSLIMTPQIYFNALGNDINSITLYKTTLGNLVDGSVDFSFDFVDANLSLNVEIPGLSCQVEGGDVQGCQIERAGLGVTYAYLDLTLTVFFFICVLWLQKFVKREPKEVAAHFITLDQYTIFVKKVPKGCGENTLAIYFENMTGEYVRDVALAQDNGELIELYKERGEVLTELWKATGRATLLAEQDIKPTRLLTAEEVGLINDERVEEVVKYYDLLLTHYHTLTEQTNLYNTSANSIAAFVTFEDQVGYHKALELLSRKPVKRIPCCSRPNKDVEPFQGMHLQVRPASPPSTVKWENMEYSCLSRFVRQLTGTILTLCALVISFAAVYGAQAYRAELSGETALDCEDLFFGDESTDSIISTFNSEYEAFKFMRNETDPEAIRLFSCFCTTYSFSDLAEALVTTSDFCHTFWISRAPLFGFTGVAAGVLSGVNIALGVIIKQLTSFERHHSVVNAEVSVAIRLFLVYTLNTGLVLLIVNAKIDGATEGNILGNGQYRDFTPDWYANVGSQILLTLSINVFSPHFMPILQYVSNKYDRLCGEKPMLQRELNERYIGPEFPYALRSAQVCVCVSLSRTHAQSIDHIAWNLGEIERNSPSFYTHTSFSHTHLAIHALFCGLDLWRRDANCIPHCSCLLFLDVCS